MLDKDQRPHALARELKMPDGSPAHAAIRAWAAVDDRYPSPLASQQNTQAIADANGVVIAKTMRDVLEWVCIDSIRDEVDDETIEQLEELVDSFTEELPGFGIVLEPPEHPDRVLWFPPNEMPTLLWYENDAFERREPFDAWVRSLFEEE